MSNPEARQNHPLTPRHFSSFPEDTRLHDNASVERTVQEAASADGVNYKPVVYHIFRTFTSE
jgi:hypothetical protein